ncbi:MAG: hypothetical protein HQK49_11285 [Oligoflexia bacterium]|nr:hypothetical protein [Oligoflexia bacterium]
MIKEVLEKKGIFSLLYVDRAGIFGGNNNSPIPFKREGFSQLKERLESNVIIMEIFLNYLAQSF